MPIPKLLDIYRFYLRVDATDTETGFFQLRPTNGELEWVFEQEDILHIWRRKLTTKLEFENRTSENKFDFNVIKAEADAYPCQFRDFYIQHRCPDGEYSPIYIAHFHANKVDFDEDHCKEIVNLVHRDEFSFILDDPYTLYLTDINDNVLLHKEGYVNKRSVFELFTGDMEDKESWVNETDVPLPAEFADWNYVAYKTEIKQTLLGGLDNRPYKVTWYAHIITQEEPQFRPDLWFEVELGVWVRKPDVDVYVWSFYDFDYARGGIRERVIHEEFFYQRRDRTGNIASGVPNGVFLNSIFQTVQDHAPVGIELKSAFYKFNDSGLTFPDNEEYADQHAKLAIGSLAFWDITNVAARVTDGFTPSAPATMTRIELINFLKSLQVKDNLVFFLEDGAIRIEHISYGYQKRNVDLTLPATRRDIKGFHRYSYDTDNLPDKEVYKWAAPSNIPEMEMSFVYYGSCVGDGKTKTYPADHLYIDLRYINLKPDDFKTIEPENRPLFMAFVTEEGKLIEDQNFPYPNSLISFGGQQSLHFWKRPYESGYLNYKNSQASVDFKSSQRIRKQVALNVSICCEDVPKFRGELLIKTQMGWGEVGTMKIKDPGNKLEVVTLHDKARNN